MGGSAQELDIAIGIHGGASGGMTRSRWIVSSARRGALISHTFEMMLAAISMIWCGVCDR